jgi:hypothetical protein
MGPPQATPELLLLTAREERFEMGRLFFAGDDTDFNFLESGCFEPLM